jgi:uncharacterized repeat protein (TIGR01451 family)
MFVRISHMVLSVVLAVCLVGVAVAVPVAGSIKVTSVAQIEVEVVGADGRKHSERKPVDKAVPGSVVLFGNAFENVGKKPATNVVISNPIPAYTEYQVGSAYGENTEITFSVDGGKSFAVAEKLVTKASDGSEQTAKASAYTHIRWLYKSQLAPGAVGEVGFKVMIK